MKLSIFESPIKVYGVPNFEKNKKLERFPEDLRKKLTYPENTLLEHLMTRTTGARAAFRTNSENIKIEMKLKTLEHDAGMSKFSCSSAAVYTGRGESLTYKGLAVPGFNDMTGDISFTKSKDTEDIMIFFPRNEIVENIIITLDDGAEIYAPTPYKYEKPVIFFGSSITEGGHAALVTNAYTALLSRWLDFEYYNFGLSGSCRGQLEIGEYICSLDPSVLVYDYDHNAPTAEFLENTHERFFKLIREKKPFLPVIFMTAPNYEHMPEADRRIEIIKTTYENAKKSGDKNVYFIDGKSFFGEDEREFCTTDTTHPNDLGFHRMAKVIEPVLKGILEKL
ncbi:MAG: hypothetical protein IKL10_04330 [Clostridia bacterium]|nr:hypothetical protein [Clostridia bacterium]